MGRSIFIEEVIEERILKLFGETKWASGILIGQSTPQRDYVVHLALTPRQESDDLSDDGSNKKGVKQNTVVNDFDEEWFVQHCRQVNCMLTGGLRILGMFVFGPADIRTKLQAKFRQTLYAVHKMICGDFPLAKWKLDQSTGQVLLQVCSATKKTTCYAIDVSDTKSNIQPADLKYQNFVSKWIHLHCSLELELNFMLQKKVDGKTRFSNIKGGLMPVLSNIANSLATVDGAILSDEQSLIMEKQKGKSSDKISTRNVKLYLTENKFEPDIQKFTSRQVLLVGTVESQAFLHPKATVKEAVDAVKCDVIRNLLTRCRLLCEDMDDNNAQDVENEKFTKWELPKRIFAPLCGGHVNISDCVFKDEDTKDILNRILELMGVSVLEEDLVSDEKFADNVTCEQLVGDRVTFNNNENVANEINSNSGSTFSPFFGASVGALTVVMAALYKWYLDM